MDLMTNDNTSTLHLYITMNGGTEEDRYAKNGGIEVRSSWLGLD